MIRFSEPRQVLRLPVDISEFSDEEKQKWLLRRRPQRNIKVQTERIETKLDSKKYLKMGRRK